MLPAVLAALAFGEALAVQEQVGGSAAGRDRRAAAGAAAGVAARAHPLVVCWCVTLLFALVAATATIDSDSTSGCSLIMLIAVSSAACHAVDLRGVLLAAAGMTVLSALSTGMFADGAPAVGDVLFGAVFVVGAVVLGRAVHGGVLRRLRLAVELDAARSKRAGCRAGRSRRAAATGARAARPRQPPSRRRDPPRRDRRPRDRRGDDRRRPGSRRRRASPRARGPSRSSAPP